MTKMRTRMLAASPARDCSISAWALRRSSTPDIRREGSREPSGAELPLRANRLRSTCAASAGGGGGARLATGAQELDDGRQHRHHDDAEDDVVELLLHDRHVAEGITEAEKPDHPRQGAGDVEHREARVAHLADTGD